MKVTLIAVAVMAVMASVPAYATSKDCGCTKTPTAYDKTQDVKISGNSAAIGDVKLTAGQAFDIAVEGRATAGNALTTVYGLIPQVNNNAKGIADLQSSKVDKSVFTADQQRQDKALAASVTAQAGIDAKQTVDLKSYADKKADSSYSTSVAHTDVKVARADADRKAGDDALGARIAAGAAVQSDRDAGQDVVIQQAHEKADAGAVRMDGIEKQAGVLDGRVGAVEVRSDKLEEGQRVQDRQMESDRQQRVDGDAQNSAAISQEARTRASQVVQLSAGISQAQATGDYAASRADQAFINAAANSQSIRRTNERVAEHSAQLANHEQRITGLEQKTNRNFGALRNQVERNKKHADAGIASVAAMANLPQLTESARFSAGVGVGARSSQQAIAVGLSSRLSHSVIGKASVASDTNSGWTVGAGVAVQW